jgi:hypothetical protein
VARTKVDDTIQTGVTIRPELAHLATPIDQVTSWPGNPRRGDQETIRASLRDHGQYAALLVQASTGYVVKGNNTLQAMIELGAKEVAAQRLELTDGQARKILAMDNRSSDRATYDDLALAALLVEMPDLDGTGWTTGELDELLRTTNHLGDAATDFLDDVITAPPAPPDPVAAAASETPAEVTSTAPAAGGGVVEYVTMSFTCLPGHRDTIRAAVRRAQQRDGAATAAEGLLAIARYYLDSVGEA